MTSPADDVGRCPTHPSVLLMRRSTTQPGEWRALLASCPLCQMEQQAEGGAGNDDGVDDGEVSDPGRRLPAPPPRDRNRTGGEGGGGADGVPREIRAGAPPCLPLVIRVGVTAGEEEGPAADTGGGGGGGGPAEVSDDYPAPADPSGPAFGTEEDAEAAKEPAKGADRGASFDLGGDMSREFVVYSSDEDCLDDGGPGGDGPADGPDGPPAEAGGADTERPGGTPAVDDSVRSAATVGDPLRLAPRSPPSPSKKVSFRTDLRQPPTARRRSVSFHDVRPSASLLRRPRYRVDASLMARQRDEADGVPKMSDDLSVDVDDLLSDGEDCSCVDSFDLDELEALLGSDISSPAAGKEQGDGPAGSGNEDGGEKDGGGGPGIPETRTGADVPAAFGGLYRDIEQGRDGTGPATPPDSGPAPRRRRRRARSLPRKLGLGDDGSGAAGRLQFVNRSQFESVMMSS